MNAYREQFLGKSPIKVKRRVKQAQTSQEPAQVNQQVAETTPISPKRYVYRAHEHAKYLYTRPDFQRRAARLAKLTR